MMKVRELIALLQTFDQELPVTGFNGQEETDFVTPKGVRLKHGADDHFYHRDGSMVGAYVDIMGF